MLFRKLVNSFLDKITISDKIIYTRTIVLYQTKPGAQMTEKDSKQKKGKNTGFYATSFEGITITANSKEELAQKLRNARENCR